LNDDEKEVLETKIARLKIFPEYIKDPWVVLSFFTDVLILLVIFKKKLKPRICIILSQIFFLILVAI